MNYLRPKKFNKINEKMFSRHGIQEVSGLILLVSILSQSCSKNTNKNPTLLHDLPNKRCRIAGLDIIGININITGRATY